MKNIISALLGVSIIFTSLTSQAQSHKSEVCAIPEVDQDTTECKSYTIQIDNNFSDDDSSRIQDAISSWRSILKSKFTYNTQNHCSLSNEKSVCVIKIIKQQTPQDKNGFYSGIRNDYELPVSAVVSIRPDMQGNDVSKIILHEFGHVLGLNHSDNESSVMFHISRNTNFSCEDKINVCSIWKCEAKCEN